MSENMMKICGKTADGTAKAVGVDGEGNVCVKRVWESYAFEAFNGAITDTETYNTLDNPIDVTEWGMVSLRAVNTLDSAVTIYLYDDISEGSSRWMLDSNDEYPQITIPANGTKIFTDADVPILNYLRHIKFRFKANTAPTSGKLQIYVMVKR